MGAIAWSLFTDYQKDINAALQASRQHEFEKYNAGLNATRQRVLDAGRAWVSGNNPASIEELIEESDGCTASILDISRASLEPHNHLKGGRPLSGVAYPVSSSRLVDIFGTDKPTKKKIEELEETNNEFLESIWRGECIYIIVYEDEKPSEIYFAGCSSD